MLRHFRRRPSVKTFNIVTLDGSTIALNLDSRSNGKDLLDKVLQECKITSDNNYFSLAVQEEESYLKWISLSKPLRKQLSGHSPYTLYFRVHIYPYNHHSLFQSISRYYLYLQVKKDFLLNRLEPSSPATTNYIAALIVQGEIGNFIPQTCSNGYIRDLKILPQLTVGMEEGIKQAHRLNRGRLPGDCQEEVLDLVQEEPTYGSVFYTVQDPRRQPVTLCVCPVGVRVAQGGCQITCFKWENIVKVTSRGKHLYFHMDASQTLNSHQVHYVCPASQVASTIASWCQTLVGFYCSIVAPDAFTTKSRLKRFFSTRRSLRRGGNPVRRLQYSHPSSNPVQRRSRRASVGGEGSKHISITSPSRTSLRNPSSSKAESKMVIYGLSGLASTNENSEKSTAISPDSSSFSIQNDSSRFDSKSPQEISEVSEEQERRDEPRQTTSLHVIQEDDRGTGSADFRTEMVILDPEANWFSDVSSISGKENHRSSRDSRNENVPVRGSVSDVEHKSVSLLVERGRHSTRSSSSRSRDYENHSTSSQPPPPLPPRNLEEAEELERSRRSGGDGSDSGGRYGGGGDGGISGMGVRGSFKDHRHHRNNGYSDGYHHHHHQDRESRDSYNHHHHHRSPSDRQDRNSSPSLHYPTAPQHRNSSPRHQSQSSMHQHHHPHRRSESSGDSRFDSPHQQHHHQQHSSSHSQPDHFHSSNSSLRRSSHVRGEDSPQSKYNNYNHRNERTHHQPHANSSSSNHIGDSESSTTSRSRSHFPEGDRPDSRSSMRQFRRRHSQGDTILVSMQKVMPESRPGPRSPASLTGGRGEHFRYHTTNSPHHHHQHGQQTHNNGAWQQEDTPQSSSLPLHINPNFSLFEEDENIENGSVISSRVSSTRHKPGPHESGRHVSRHKRLRHSTITSLTSLSSEVTGGGLSRLGSIASLNYQANFAELSQAESVTGPYMDPHVRSMVFEASQNSQGTEL